ncbi:MAG: NahK/ErcS family hybrid sensor histidine kinase/response regulator [Pseudomonadota bacterium]
MMRCNAPHELLSLRRTGAGDLGSGWLVLLSSIAYVAVLFGIAHWGDKKSTERRMRFARPVVYSLALGVYCTSWTFYGAVGTAVDTGWGYLPIYLGPIITVLLAWGMIRRMVAIAKRQNLTSIADFISARYGKGRALAVLVTVIAVVGTVPYIALQLKAVGSTFDIVSTATGGANGFSDTALLFAFLLGLFAILFGTRRIDASEHHHGMILAIAFESVVKLLAFLAIALLAVFLLGNQGGMASAHAASDQLFSFASLPDTFVTQCLLAGAAIFCLPRQFHVAIVEAHEDTQLRSARWLFPLYLACFAVAVVPITLAGLHFLPSGSYPGDAFVLALPIESGSSLLGLLAFIGGFSAATGMVIVATVTLSTMVSNEIVMPLLFRIRQLGISDDREYSTLLITIRRLAIAAIMLVAYAYYQFIDKSAALASIGLLAFSAAAQFAPLIVFGMAWPRANRLGAIAGLTSGFALWLYTLFLPSLAAVGVLGVDVVAYGPFGASWLRPEALLFDLDLHPLTHGVAWSLLVNTLVMLIVSAMTGQSVVERIQAHSFVMSSSTPAPVRLAPRGGDIVNADLRALAARFVGEAHATRALAEFADANAISLDPAASADRELIRFTERLLAGAVGTSSARIILTAALRRSGTEIGDMVMLLDETSQAIRFNRQLLEATLENISQGISVVDSEQRLVGWNSRYVELMGYPDGLVHIGKPIAELLEFNAARGFLGAVEAGTSVEQRLAYVRNGEVFRAESTLPDGRVIEIRGQPMPDGGYVTTYSDISDAKASEIALRASEKRVRTYTDNMPAMIAYVDASRRFRFANKAYARYARLPREEIVGKHITDVLDAKDFLSRSTYLDAAFAGARQVFELELTSDSGEPQHTLGTYIPDKDDQGVVTGIYAMFQDITVRRRAELALVEAKVNLEQRVEARTDELQVALREVQEANHAARRANASKTRFFAAAAHDLLQPVNAAKLFSALLSEASDDMPQDQRELVARVEQGLASVEDLLSSLLDISRFDAGGHTPEVKAFPVQDLFEPLAAQFEQAAREQGLSLTFVPSSLWVESDPALLRRILQNFISNAKRYTESGGIAVGCRRTGDQVAIAVYDTGVGIAPEHQQRVFQEFARLPQSRKNEKRGLGLGLAIVERIARLLEHPVRMRSEEGSGSCFEVLVPRAQPQVAGADASAAEEARPGTPLSGQFMICVDNEPDILDGMQALLTRWGARPVVATDMRGAEQALQDIRTEHDTLPRLLLVDYHLDHGDTGVRVVERLQQLAGEPIPAVVLTADRTNEVRHDVTSAGHTVLYKPVKPAALRALVTSILSKNRAA